MCVCTFACVRCFCLIPRVSVRLFKRLFKRLIFRAVLCMVVRVCTCVCTCVCLCVYVRVFVPVVVPDPACVWIISYPRTMRPWKVDTTLDNIRSCRTREDSLMIASPVN